MSELTPEERKLRDLLWAFHPCSGKYGDDGEIQCGRFLPTIDFLRDTLEDIEAKVPIHNAQLAKIKRATRPKIQHSHQWIPGGTYEHSHTKGDVPHGHHRSRYGETKVKRADEVNCPNCQGHIGKFTGNYHCANCGKTFRIAEQAEFLAHQASCDYICPTCQGEGTIPIDTPFSGSLPSADCPECGGSKEIRRIESSNILPNVERTMEWLEPCPTCQGKRDKPDRDEVAKILWNNKVYTHAFSDKPITAEITPIQLDLADQIIALFPKPLSDPELRDRLGGIIDKHIHLHSIRGGKAIYEVNQKAMLKEIIALLPSEEEIRKKVLEEIEFSFSAVNVYCPAAGRELVNCIDVSEWQALQSKEEG